MNYLPGRSAAAAMIPAALSMRLFTGMAVDFPYAANASWMCPLIGLILYLPFAFAVNQAAQLANSSPWDNLTSGLLPLPVKAIELSISIMLLYDATVHVRLLASSSNIIALGDVTVHLLIVPLGIVAAAVVLLGGDALGSSARIALRILPFFAVIMLAVQLRSYTVGWLTPLLGTGAGGILGGGMYCAGCMALLTLPWMVALPDRHHRGLLRCIAFPAIGASILLVLLHMGFPAMPNSGFTQAARIELVLSNGRMSLSPQFLLNLLWFGGLLYLFSTEMTAAAAFLHRICPALPVWILALLTSGGVSAVAIFNPDWLQQSSAMAGYAFPLLGAVFALLLTVALFRNKGKETCVNQE